MVCQTNKQKKDNLMKLVLFGHFTISKCTLVSCDTHTKHQEMMCCSKQTFISDDLGCGTHKMTSWPQDKDFLHLMMFMHIWWCVHMSFGVVFALTFPAIVIHLYPLSLRCYLAFSCHFCWTILHESRKFWRDQGLLQEEDHLPYRLCVGSAEKSNCCQHSW